MHHPASCFAHLSRVELATVAHCQQIARSLGLSVVSSGVFAAEAGQLAGLHFWLVSAPASPSAPVSSPMLVWLSAERRLLCGCKRRRSDGALTCCHAQAVRLWLLAAAAAGAPVPPVPPSGGGVPVGSSAEASAPAPVADVAGRLSQLCACGDHEDCAGVGWSFTPDNQWPCECACHLSAPDPEQPEESTDQCPACELPASAGVLRDWGVCAECLDLWADAESQPRPQRCQTCGQPATGESGNGIYCSACQQRMRATAGPDRYELMGVSHP